MTVSVVFYPNDTKKNLKTGKIPIYLRITHARKKAEARLNVELTENDFSKWNPFSMRLDERNSLINAQLDGINLSAQKFLILNEGNLSDFDVSQIRDHILGKEDKNKQTILEYVNKYLLDTVTNNTQLTTGTKKNYRKAVNHLKAYIEKEEKTGLLLKKMDNSFALSFKDYLINENETLDKAGMTESSAAGNIKKFKTIFDRAVLEGSLERNPFKIVRLKNSTPRRERLNISQVKKIFRLDCKGYPHQEVCRDIFLFSVFTGLAYHDTMSLTKQNFSWLSNNSKLLRIKRTKTDILTESVLPLQALYILEKYETHPSCLIRKKVLPYKTNKELNLYLKLIADKTELPINLTSHIARHTFRQLLAEASIEDNGVIKRMMGQSRKYDIDEIYYSVTESRLIAAKERFQTYLDQHLIP